MIFLNIPRPFIIRINIGKILDSNNIEYFEAFKQKKPPKGGFFIPISIKLNRKSDTIKF